MYKAIAKRLIRTNVAKLNAGDSAPLLAMYADDAVFSFPGDSIFSTQFRPAVRGRRAHKTHIGKAEIAAFLDLFIASKVQLEVEDIVIEGPPWNCRGVIIANGWSTAADGSLRYQNRAALYVRIVGLKIVWHEDFEDTEQAAAFSEILTAAATA